jgi:hypothetical protein
MPMGVSLEPPRIRRCANHCDFCFVDGNPQGMRQALYIRDDDYRLSFRYGNFATLTNLKPWDLERIVEYRLSPLYVSVHATDPVVRRWLLRNPEAPEVIPQLHWFAERGIAVHTQVVLVPGINDGPQLVRTLGDLYDVGESVLSVSVVPVALTEFSKHALGERGGQLRGSRRGRPRPPLVLRGGRSLSPGGPGVAPCGVVRRLRAARERRRSRALSAVTHRGRARAARQRRLARQAHRGHHGLAALKDRRDLDLALLPAESVNDNLLFMDDLEAHDLASKLPMPVRLSYDFADALVNQDGKDGKDGNVAVFAVPAAVVQPKP